MSPLKVLTRYQINLKGSFTHGIEFRQYSIFPEYVEGKSTTIVLSLLKYIDVCKHFSLNTRLQHNALYGDDSNKNKWEAIKLWCEGVDYGLSLSDFLDRISL